MSAPASSSGAMPDGGAGHDPASVALTEGRHEGGSRRTAWLVFLGYIGFALLMTWPLALNLSTAFPGENTVDAWGHYWNMWWFRRVLLTGGQPYWTDLWFAPEGTSLVLHTLAPYNSLLGLLPTLVAGPLVAYNLVALAAIALSAQAAFLLARHVTGHTGASVIAGLAFGGSPYLMGHLTVGHLNVAALLWLPLFALAFLLAGEGRRWALPVAALCLFMTALTEWHTTLFALVLGGLLGLWALLGALWRRAGWARPARMLAAGLLGALLLAPLVVATVLAVRAAGERAELGERWAQEHSANLLAFLLPQDLHPLWGDQLAAWRKVNLAEVLSEGRVSLGLVVVALAVVGVVGLRWRAAPWLAAVGLGIVLALGPELHVGEAVRSIVTPYELFTLLPLADVSRTPARFSVLATLGLAVLAAAGVSEIARRLPPRAATAVVALLGALVVAEFLTAPFDLERPPDTVVARQIGQQIAETDPQGTVLTLPYRRAEQERVFHQVHHERPIYGGFIPRDLERPFRTNTPGFAELGAARPFRDIFEAMPDPLAVLNYYHVRYVLVYPGEILDDAPGRALLANLRQVLRQPKAVLTAEDGSVEAWGVPPAPLTEPFMRADRGWSPVEMIPQLGRTRWMGEQGRLVLERPNQTPVTVQFTAVSYRDPRRIEIRAGDRVLDVVTVIPEPRDFTVALPADQGSTRLTLTSLDGTDSPSKHGDERDKRDLSVAVARVRLATGPPTASADEPVHPALADTARALAG